MWTRKELKDRAKAVLKGIYWKAFGISIVIALAGGSNGRSSSGGGGRSNGSSIDSITSEMNNFEVFSRVGFFILIGLGVILFFIALRTFLGWYFLGVLALGVGVLFVMPYENATNAELYLNLSNNKLENNSFAPLVEGE